MAHNLVKGIDRMAATRIDTVWHRGQTEQDGRLTQVVYAGDAESTMLEMASIVWPTDADNDVARTVGIQTADGTIIETHKATISPSGRVLGVVGAEYNPVPFKFIMTEWLLALAKAGGIPETLGTFDGGRSFFGCLQVADAWQVPGDTSQTRAMCNVLSSHDGTRGIRGSFATFRVICANTAAMYAAGHDAIVDAAEKAKAGWVSIRHAPNAAQRIQDAVAWMTDGKARAESEAALMARMASKLVSRADVDKFIDRYINKPDDASQKLASRRDNQRDAFLGVLGASDLGNHALSASGVTAYGLFQAVTNFEDWQSQTRGSELVPVGTRRAFRAFLGERETEKVAARSMILELAK